jgi:hypothetical protein
VTATTPANSELAAIFGGTTNNFPLLQQFNTYGQGLVTVSKQ